MRQEFFDNIMDLLVDFDELGFAPTTAVPSPEVYAIEWRNKLTQALRDCREQSNNYVKLPCNVGDTVYAAITPIDEFDIGMPPFIDEWKVYGLLYKNDKWYAENADGVFLEIGTDLCKLTREEAEQVLEKVKGGE